MSVSAVSGDSSPSISQAEAEAQRTVYTLKKQQDVAKDQGQALVQLIEQATPAAAPQPSADGVGRLINVYA